MGYSGIMNPSDLYAEHVGLLHFRAVGPSVPFRSPLDAGGLEGFWVVIPRFSRTS